MDIVIIGTGRAGTALATVFERAGYVVQRVHHDELADIHLSALAIILCVPDDAIATVSSALPTTDAVVLHVAGSRGLDVLGDHSRVGSLHPLVMLPSGLDGADRLPGSVFAVDGDPLAVVLVEALGGRPVVVQPENRAAYHAAACVAANHVVALMQSVQDIANSIGMDVSDFAPLAHQALLDVVDVGPRRALTGPAARGDWATIDAHLAAIPESTRALYVAATQAALAVGEQRPAPSPA